MNPDLRKKLQDFVDALETEYGQLEGVELRFEHPIVEDEGSRQEYANIKEFVIIHLSRTEISL